ncbi:MAG: IgGFc-binding protein [Myxococcales bacterium]|nr:IgGFc-binding protein [Myxococcales bacterium]
MKRSILALLTAPLLASACGSSRNSFDDGPQTGASPTDPQLGGGLPGETAGDAATTCEQAAADKSTMGCEFYSVPPDSLTITRGACFAAFLVNTSNSVAEIKVERDGQSLDASKFAYVPSGSGAGLKYEPLPSSGLAGGQVAILFLSRSGSTACPAGVTPAVTQLTSVSGTGRGAAFRIATSAPVVAYDIYPYGGGASALTSATLLLPTSAWDKNYVAVAGYKKSAVVEEDQPTLSIVAAEDGTTVTINPTAAIVGKAGSVDPAPKGAPKAYSLGRGQILQFVQDAELTGSAIASDKPIGVWGGSICASIPATMDSACDTIHQELPPVRAMGSEFAGVRYRNRFDGKEESPPWRLVGAVDGTKLTWEPSKPVGAPDTLAQGQVVELSSPGGWVVRSQDKSHPFYLSAHMTGWGAVSSVGDNRGDPESVNVLPTAQYLKSYVFFTDPTYPETNLVVVRKKSDDGWKDVELDCAGVLGGWQPLGSSGTYEATRVDLVRGNFQGQNGCDNGKRRIRSDGLFGVTVWAWGSAATGGSAFGGGSGFFSQAVSYAYPAGGSLKPINDVVVSTGPK